MLWKRYISPEISAEARWRFHVARDLGVSILVAFLVVFLTHRKLQKMEYEVEHREQHLAEVLKESTNAIVCIDPEGEIVYWNRGAEILYGYRPGEILGQSAQKLVPDGTKSLEDKNNHTREFLAKRLDQIR